MPLMRARLHWRWPRAWRFPTISAASTPIGPCRGTASTSSAWECGYEVFSSAAGIILSSDGTSVAHGRFPYLLASPSDAIPDRIQLPPAAPRDPSSIRAYGKHRAAGSEERRLARVVGRAVVIPRAAGAERGARRAGRRAIRRLKVIQYQILLSEEAARLGAPRAQTARGTGARHFDLDRSRPSARRSAHLEAPARSAAQARIHPGQRAPSTSAPRRSPRSPSPRWPRSDRPWWRCGTMRGDPWRQAGRHRLLLLHRMAVAPGSTRARCRWGAESAGLV